MIKFLIAFAIAFSAIAATKIKDNTLKVGKQDGQDVYIYANEGSANSPFLVFDVAEGKWKQSNDGTNIIDIGSGSENFVDLTGNQTITGIKTFNAQTILKDGASPVSLLYKIISNDELTNYFSVDSNGLNTDLNFAMNGTGAIKVPVGDTSERPTPAQGMLRYNTEEESFEGYNGTEWGAIGGGGGGSAGINFVFDPSFEKGDLNPDTDASAVESYQTYTADDKLYAEFNEQYYRAAYTGLTANNTYVRDTFARTDLDGKQGLFSIWIKVNAENFELCLRTDDSGFASACDDAYKLNILGDNTWRKYEIPFVYGAASVEYEIKNASYTGDVTIELDNIYVGTMPDGYISKIDTAITDWKDYTPSFQGFGSVSNIDIKYRRVGDSLEVSGDFTTGTNTAIEVQIGLPNNLSIADNHTGAQVGGWFFRDSASSTSKGSTVIYTAGDTFVNVSDLGYIGTGNVNPHTPSNGNAFSSSTRHSIKFKVPIAGWSSEKSTVVTQDTELTAKTANEFSASFDGSVGSGTIPVLSEDYQGVLSCTTVALGTFNCSINNITLAEIPAIQCTVTDTAVGSRLCSIRNKTVNSFQVQILRSDTATAEYRDYDVTITKQGADVNKSQTIVGKFENINSTDLIEVNARLSTSSTVVNSTVVNLAYEQIQNGINTNNAYNTSTGVFTSPRDTKYKVCANLLYDITSWSTGNVIELFVWKNGTSKISIHRETMQNNVSNQYRHLTGSCVDVLMLTGETFTIATSQNSGVSKTVGIADDVFNNLTIQEMPDYQAIVKNLSNQKTKCQTKYLSADVTADGSLSDLSFSNLEVGKKYRASYNFKSNRAGGYDNVGLTIAHNSQIILSPTHSYDGATNNGHSFATGGASKSFTATTSTVLTSSISIASGTTIEGNGTPTQTWIELCELPDTYIETTEF